MATLPRVKLNKRQRLTDDEYITGKKTPSQSVTARNSGFPSPTANLYRVADGKSIDRTSLTLTQSGSDYKVTISIPPNSVLGISIQ
jgi:hypothetical protein